MLKNMLEMSYQTNCCFWWVKRSVGSRFGGVSFTVDVSEPKPNMPNTMNLVKKRAQELGLCEDFINGWAGSLGNRIVNGVVEERVKVRPRASSEDEFFFSYSDTPPIELPGVFRISPLSPSWDLSGYIYSSAPFILAIHLSIAQVTTWVSVPSSISLHLLWVAVGSMTLFRGYSFINVAR